MSADKKWRCCLYLSRVGDDDTQCMAVTFKRPHHARRFLDELLQSDGYVWEECLSPHRTPPCECTIRSESGIVVSTRWYPETMREVVDHEYTVKELGYSLQEPYLSWARYFRNGPPQPRTIEEATADSQRKRTRTPRESTPRADHPAGYIHVGDVALSLGIDAKQARVALRKLFPEKPAYGWWFDPATLDDLKARIKEVVK